MRAFPPSIGNAQNKRGIYVSVGSVAGTQFQIRVRESTMYGRWTTNGYDFHIELENTTSDSICAEIVFYPNSGDTYSGTWNGGLLTRTLTIPPFGANKMILNKRRWWAPTTRARCASVPAARRISSPAPCT